MWNQLAAVQIMAEVVNLHYEISSPLKGFPNIEYIIYSNITNNEGLIDRKMDGALVGQNR